MISAYSAGQLINYNSSSQTENAPFAGHACDGARSAWDKCEYDDYIMRIKVRISLSL